MAHRRSLLVASLAFAATMMFGSAAADAQTVVRVPANPRSAEPAAKAAFAKLDTLKVSVDFEDTPLKAAVQFLKQVSGVNILIDKAVLDERDIDETRITLQVNEVSMRSALALILEFSNLVVRWKHSVLMVTTPAKGRGKPEARGPVERAGMDGKARNAPLPP